MIRVELIDDYLFIRGGPGELRSLDPLAEVAVYEERYDPGTARVTLEKQVAEMAARLGDAMIAKPVLYPLIREQAEKLGILVEEGPGLRRALESLGREISVAEEFPYQLRSYQIEAWRTFSEKQRLLLVLPTGSGKTVVALYAIWRLRRPTLVLVPTVTLAAQWIKQLRRIARNVCFYKDGLCDVTVATYQAFNQAPRLAKRFYLLVSDEGHHLPASKWKAFIENGLWPARLVLSATPRRRDKNHELIEWFVGWRRLVKTYDELAREGWVAPLEIIVVKTPPSDPDKVNELLMRYSYSRDIGRGAAKAKAALRRELLRDPVKESIIARMIGSSDSKSLVFVEYVDQAYRLAKMIGAEVITGKEPMEKREKAIARFRAGLVNTLVVTSAAEEGVDLPDADTVYMTTVPGERQLLQRLGRVMRPKPLARAVFVLTVPGQNSEIQKLRRILADSGITAPIKVYRASMNSST